MKHHLILIYDGIENSVFVGQVLAPFAQKLIQFPADRGLIVSFEKKKPSDTTLTLLPKVSKYRLSHAP